MVCSECTFSFFYDPVKVGIIVASLATSIFSFFMAKKSNLPTNKRLIFIYAHIFFLIFPLTFYIFFRGCQLIYDYCSEFKTLMLILSFTAVTAFAAALVFAPILFIMRYTKRSLVIKNQPLHRFIAEHSRKLRIKNPMIYLVNIAKPIAFSFSDVKSKIFISVGLTDLLSKRELEAVLLHELKHIKNRSSLLKFSTFFMKFISPLAWFTALHKELNNEEMKADNYAARAQKTKRHLENAKRKINEFNYLSRIL